MRKKKQSKPQIDEKIIKQLLESVDDPKDLFGQDGIIKQLSKRFLEAALEAEIEEHLGYEKHDTSGNNSGNNWLFKRQKWLFPKDSHHRTRTS